LMATGPHTVLGYHTAAALFGFGVASSDAIHIVVPDGEPFPQRRGIVVHRSVVPVGDPVIALGLPCTPAARWAVDLARSLPRLDALPVLDAALASGTCEAEDLTAEVKFHDGLRGVRSVRELVRLADGGSACRQESQLRLILADAGITDFEA